MVKERKNLEKPKGFVEFNNETPKPKWYKVVGVTLFGATLCGALGLGGVSFYNNQVKYPSELKVKESSTGRYALKNYQKALNTYSFDGFSGNYLSSESKLQNDNESRISFIKSVLSTVKYSPLKEDKLNKYGSVYLTKEGKKVKDTSFVNYGEKVDFTYIDYSKLVFEDKVVNDLITESGIKQSDSDFVEKITDLFCKYIADNKDNLPLKTETRVVPLEKVSNGYSVSEKEDEYLDQLLFSSDEFHSALDRFSLLAQQGSEVESSEHKEWDKKSDKDKEDFTEPYKWEKYRFIKYDWVGFYAKLSEQGIKEKDFVFPKGLGTKESPAGLNTPVMTYVLSTVDGKEVKTPIKVTLTKVTYGSDAIKDIMKGDIRNRGLDPKSPTKYIYTEWKVENLTSGSVEVYSNSGLSDAEANISPKTGVMYGLLDTAELKGYQFTNLQDWYSSTELPEKYLVWGKDFAKRVEPVWFDVLKLSDEKVVIPDDAIQTKDVSANKNESDQQNE